MEHGITLLAILHVFIAIILVTIVLLQDSKGGGMGAVGGGSSQTIFGATGAANFLVKLTRVLAATFMLTCISLTYILSQRSGHSVVDKISGATAPVTAPAATTNQAPPAQAPVVPAPNGK